MPARRSSIRTVVIQGLTILLALAFIELWAGFALKGIEERLAILPGVLVMLPPLLDLRGNINGALAFRLGSALHLGIIRPKLSFSTEIKVNFISSMILSFIASATVGAIAFFVNILIGIEAISLFTLVTIALIAGVLSGLVLSILTIAIAIASYKGGWDPDVVTSPTVATIGDFVMAASILLAVLLVV